MAVARVGLIVNPIAGMGGRVGLKGTDGEATLAEARERGAEPVSPARAARVLERARECDDEFELVTAPGRMGESEARSVGLDPIVVETVAGSETKTNTDDTATETETSADDTVRAAERMVELGVDLLLFAGGDGTARDVLDAVGDAVPVLGIPTGVKVYSGVFASSPEAAGELVELFLTGRTDGTQPREVMDIDEEAYRNDRLSARLYGYLNVPYRRTIVQNPKSRGSADETDQRVAIARNVLERMEPGTLYVVGPGTTAKTVLDELGLDSTLLGVDAVLDSELVGTDLRESDLLDLVRDRPAKIVVGVIGGQGCLFGRGNQQFSPAVIRAVGLDDVVVVATKDKILSLPDRALFVDTNDPELDAELAGYVRVVVGGNEQMVVRVRPPT